MGGLYLIYIESPPDDMMPFWLVFVLFLCVNVGVFFMVLRTWWLIRRTPVLLQLDDTGIHFHLEERFIPWEQISHVNHTVLSGTAAIIGGIRTLWCGQAGLCHTT